MRKFINVKTISLLVVIMVVVSLGLFQLARAQAVQTRSEEIIGLLNALKGASDADKQIILSALNQATNDVIGKEAVLGGEVASYCAGNEAVANTCNWAFSSVLIEPAKDRSGNFTSNVSSTIAFINPTILKAITVNASSTNNVVTSKETLDVGAYYYALADMECRNLGLYIKTAPGITNLSVWIATSTALSGVNFATTTGDLIFGPGIMASTTITTVTNSWNKSAGEFSAQNKPGSFWGARGYGSTATSSILIKAGTYIFTGVRNQTATSADSLLPKGGFNFVGYMTGDCVTLP